MLLIHKASAGSGKTYNLVFEYLKILLGKKTESGYILDEHPNDNHKKILAITFTNKATEEMKKRIVKELDLIAGNSKNSDHSESLLKAFGTQPKKLQDSAKKALTDVLFDYSNFNVSTIDSFFQMILRSFAFDVDLIGNFNVELNDDFVFSVGVSDLKKSLHLRNRDKFVKEWISDFMENAIKSGKSWDVFRDNSGISYGGGEMSLNSFAQQLKTENVKKHHNELGEWISNEGVMKKLKGRLGDILKNDLVEISKLSRDLYALLSTGKGYSSNAIKFFGKFKDYKGNDSGIEKLTLYKAMLKGDVQTKQLCNKSAEDPDTVIGMSLDIGNLLRHKATASAILENIHMLGLLGEIEANITGFSNDNNIILLSNTNEILRRIINKEDAPYIYERVGTRIYNFLIDEFQDTSRMQWENLMPLLDESLSGGNDDLIIGDVKQSIYRFRNSDPHLLKNEVEGNFSHFIEGDDAKTKSVPNTNWRSCRDIVLFNNTFFKALSEELRMGEYYENVAQKISEKNRDKRGFIRFEILEQNDKDKSNNDICEKVDLHQESIRRTIATVQDMLNRNYSQKDIAILVNTNSEGRDIISAFMDYVPQEGERQINVISEESLFISNSPVVRTVISALISIDAHLQSENKEGWEESEGRRSVYLSDFIHRFEYNISQGIEIEQAISKAASGRGEDFDLENILINDKPTTLDDLVDKIINKYITDKDVLTEQTPFIQAFQDAVLDYMDFYGSNVHEFLKWWELKGKKLSISSPDNIDAVNIMTIHKSKGLEFPCIIIPFCDWEFDKDGGVEWVEVNEKIRDFLHKEGEEDLLLPPILPIKRNDVNTSLECFKDSLEAEERNSIMDTLNKTYVAFTRAEKELIMFAPEVKKDLSKKMVEIFSVDKEPSSPELYVNLGKHLDGKVFEMGEREIYVPKQVKDSGEEKESEPEVYQMPEYELVIDEERYKYKEQDYVDRSDPQRYEGIMKHRIMEHIKVPSDLDNAIYYARSKGFITEDEAKLYKAEIAEGLKDARVQEWFSPDVKVRNEVDVVTIVSKKDGKKAEIRRPDRIVQTSDGRTIVIDYKFGEKAEEKHVKQVYEYVKILRDAGYNNVFGKIWYMSEGNILDI